METELFNISVATDIGEEKLWFETSCTPLINWYYVTSCVQLKSLIYIYWYIYIYIILIILSCCQHGYHWSSLATPPNRSSLLVGSQGYTPYPHRAAVCRFEMVVLLLFGHMTGVHRSTSLMSSSLLLQQCPACLVRLALIVFVMGGRWPYSCCFVGCCLQDLFKIARSILVQLPSSFFFSRFVSVHVVHPYSSIDTTAAWKKLRFILSVKSDFHMTNNLSIAVHAFVRRVSMSVSVDETLLPR